MSSDRRQQQRMPYVGRPLRRPEDVRFVQGRGRYVDDLALPGMAWCAFVRSPHAPARIPSLSTARAAAPPGVLAVLTAADWAVTVDPETGIVTLRDFCAVDDCGVLINPMIVEGQVHGGLAQGVGQALREEIVYDRDTGQLTTGSFMDYAMPRAADLPAFCTAFIATPAPGNPLGVKGASESGAIGAPAAIGNAVIDALWHPGVRDIGLPITSEHVWRALRGAQQQ